MADDRGQYIGLRRGMEKSMRDTVTVDLRLSLPWWWKPYLYGAAFLRRLGVKIDVDGVVKDIVDRARITVS